MAYEINLEPDNWINSDPDRMMQVETWIFDASLCDYEFWLNVSERICINPETGKDMDDFDRTERNIIFTGIRSLYRLNYTEQTEGITPNNPDPEILQAFLLQEAAQGNLCTAEEVPEVISFYKETLSRLSPNPHLTAIAIKFVPLWLSKKRAKYLGATAKHMTLEQLLSASERHSDAVSSVSASGDDIVLYGKHKRYQEESGGILLTTLPSLSRSLGGMFKGDAYMFQAPTGGGKCFAKGTEIILFNGDVKRVEDIIVGDLLMGPDSKPRRVVSLARGREQMYRITPVKGDYYEVNESHILSLKIGKCPHGVKSKISNVAHKSGDVVNLTVKEYLQSSTTFKHVSKGWRTGVVWDSKLHKQLPIPAYILGLWLGDGLSRTSALTTIDAEIEAEWLSYGHIRNLTCRREAINGGKTKAETLFLKTERGVVNPLLEDLKGLNLINNKHIPKCYLTASEIDRMELLAGILDTDGTNHRSGFDYISKSEKLAQDVAFLARSLGMAAYIKKCKKKSQNNTEGVYYRIGITGDKCYNVPLRLNRKTPNKRLISKDHLLHGIKSVTNIGEGDYYGFTLEGPDRLFLLKDFTVVHNTVMAVQLLVDLIGSNNCGIFISTEQPWKELEPRIIANTCQIDISHDALKNRFDYEALKAQKFHISKVDEWERAAAGKFAFFHWNSDNTQSVKTDMEATLRKGKALLGKDPDFVILDWIGGAIGSEANHENLRFTYQNTADAFAAAAQKHHFIGIAFAQSKADKVYYSLSSEHLAECKTMHRKYTALVGITAITAKDEKDMDGSKAKYENKQYFDVAKSRKGEPARIAVDRLFQFQKFQERGKVGGGVQLPVQP